MNNQVKAIIVPCGKRKAWDRNPHLGDLPAERAYVGPLFSAKRKYARALGLPWYILSAKYGFLTPETVIGPYNVSFNDRASNPVNEVTLRSQAEGIAGLGLYQGIISIASGKYDGHIATAFSGLLPVEFPLAGKNMFYQMNWLKQERERALNVGRSTRG